MKAVCPNCKKEVDLSTRVGAKLGGAALGAMFGGGITRHWLGMVLGGLAGRYIGQAVLATCPDCRVALEIADVVL